MKLPKGIVVLFVLLLILGVTCMNVFGFLGFGGSASWKEEALLHDGSKIIVERSQTRGGRGEVGQSPIKEHSIIFTLPGSHKVITWKDEYSEDVGHSNFDLLALHILNGAPYIAVSTYGCLAYNKWGRPNPPYVFFKFNGNTWQRIPLSEFPREFKKINLVINASAHEKKLVKQGLATAQMVRELNKSLKQKEFKSIIREPLEPESGGCPKLVFYKGAWVGPSANSIGRWMMDRKNK